MSEVDFADLYGLMRLSYSLGNDTVNVKLSVLDALCVLATGKDPPADPRCVDERRLLEWLRHSDAIEDVPDKVVWLIDKVLARSESAVRQPDEET